MTAVSWLAQELPKIDIRSLGDYLKLVEQAKAMEKEQMIKAHLEGWSDAYDYLQDNGNKPARQAEEYYNETYNK